MPDKGKSLRHRVLVEALAQPKPRVTLDELPIPFPDVGGGVNKQEEMFLRHWCSSYGAPEASAVYAGYPAATAKAQAFRMLANARINRRLAEIEREMMLNASIDGENLFREIVTQNLRIARAKVPIQVWNPPCRYCYGDNHEYQRTHAEFEKDWDSHCTKPIRINRNTGKPIRVPIFDPMGGDGYDPTLPPNSECPECKGEGDTKHPIVRIKDSRFFTAEERELFQGAEVTKSGVKTIWKDQSQARAFLNDLALRMTEYRRPEDAIDITEMSVDRLRQFLEFARNQGFDVDPEALEELDEERQAAE
jgi:phage terminase small subunit